MAIYVPPYKEKPAPLAPPTVNYGLDDDGYLVSDGQPMAETEEHQDTMLYVITALKHHFRHRQNVYVAGNNFIHYEKDDRYQYVSPDCYVVFGVDNTKRRKNFKIWEEGATPSVIFEFTSKSTRHEDDERKCNLYEQVFKTQEYYRFDPLSEYLDPPLNAQELYRGRYRPMEWQTSSRVYSEVLGLDVGYEEGEFRLYLPGDLKPFASPMENAVAREEAEQQLEEERKRAQTAEAEITHLRAELDALRGGKANA